MLLEFTDWSWLILGVLAVASLLQLYYYWFVFGKFAFYKKTQTINSVTDWEPVSVIIAARNEYRNLEKNLKSILEQDYPNFEVIVVNDCSWDDSQNLLEYMQEQYSHLKICKLIEQEKYPTGKKFALTIGIKAAQHNKLLFTDADCVPASNQWIRNMVAAWPNQKEIVLGYSPYNKAGGLLNLFIRFEAVLTATKYFSAAILKKPFMGVGRNLAYSRELFFKQKGFASHQHILSGDDDLFVNRAATRTNVSIQLAPDSFMFTEPKKNFSDWVRQKTRHISAGKYYHTQSKVFLGLYYASVFLFYLSLIPALLTHGIIYWVLSVYGLRLLSQLIIFYLILKKLKSVSLIWFAPIFDLLYLFYISFFGVRGLFIKNRKIW